MNKKLLLLLTASILFSLSVCAQISVRATVLKGNNKEKGIMPHGDNKLIGIHFPSSYPGNDQEFNIDSTVGFICYRGGCRYVGDNSCENDHEHNKCRTFNFQVHNYSKKEIIIYVSTVNIDAAKETWPVPPFNLKPGETKYIYGEHETCVNYSKFMEGGFVYLILNIQYTE